ncbi:MULTISPECIES: hypothetical protein [unclassified Haloferax]|uniref:hypothetical protein n=1 Tax=unclassified Haloferax TaxID=2625095 RepID=UPI0002B09CA6|nr:MULTISPECIES: hypothetical protein [unclassified Haloferax]ELZ56812.1 hypothetical protein C460_13187 [Haloferax sp. ATCC BAA-646]ELZ68439.1 hypothetical protein C459_00385 [Haloferax sp. ATCC BAA-645]ELZ68754.1 hypothetical protein C458_08318 [Haloferax sp. ATCC BAA-644]
MARFRALPLAALAALIVLSGCVGVPTIDTSGESPSATTKPATATTTAEPTPTDSATTTETDERYFDCNATLSVDPADEVPSDATVFDYANLSTERRAEFDAAVGGSTSAESADAASFSERTDAYEFWVERPYVRYENETYTSVVAIC